MRHRIGPAAPLFALLLLIAAGGLLAACGSGEKGGQAQAATQESGTAGSDTAATPASADVDPIQVIGQGQEVDVTEHLVEGKTTVVDFYSDYCPPCKRIAPYLEKLHAKGGDVAVLKVDINRPGQRGIDWGSPVARQYGLRSIPHFRIYDARGELLAEGQAAYQKLIGFLEEAQIEG